MKIAFYSPLKPLSHPNPSGDREIARGLHAFLSARAEVFVLSEFRTRLFYRSPRRVFQFLGALFAAYQRARREKPDVFFTYHLYYKAPDPIGFVLAWWFGKPYFVFEGMYSRKAARRWGFWAGYFLTRAALRYATRVFCDKSEDQAFLEKWFPGKSMYLPPSVDLARFSGEQSRGAGDGAPVIVTVAMLRPDRKTEGVEFLLACLGDLRAQGLDFRWWHVGGGAREEAVRRLSAEKLGEKGALLGLKSAEELPSILAAADIFAFPGLDESFGLVYVEAQAAGLPVVAFRNGGIPDAVSEGRTALLTPVLDRAAYTAALRELIQNPRRRAEMGAEARLFAAEKFDRSRNYESIGQALGLAHPR